MNIISQSFPQILKIVAEGEKSKNQKTAYGLR